MKEQILKLRLEGKSYNKIKEILKCSKSTISYHCAKLPNNRDLLLKKVISKRIKKKHLGNCIICNKEFFSESKKQKCCSKSCAQTINNIKKYEEYINNWKNKKVSGGSGDKSGHGKVSKHVRKYIFNKYNSQCSLCKWSNLNIYTNTIPLEIEHIDGNPMNHIESNLTLLCPNCHSLTKGHSTSKGNGRRYYREKYHKEKWV